MKGFSLIEILLAVSLLAIFSVAIIGGLVFAEQSVFTASQYLKAVDTAEEGLEAARNLRDEKWANLVSGNNGVATTTGHWSLSGTSDTVDEIFTRKVNISSVDSSRMKLTGSATWSVLPTKQNTVELVTYLTNWRRSTSAGSTPTLYGTFNLTVANSGNNVADAISIAFKNPYVYLGRTSNSNNEFFVLDVSNPAAPILDGSLALDSDPADMVASGNYVYIASNSNTTELQVIDVSTPTAPSLATSFGLTVANSGNATANGLSISISGSTLYFLRANSGGAELIIFNIAVPTAPAILGTLDLNGDPNDSFVAGSYLYVASSDDSSELEVIGVSNPLLPSLTGTLNLNSGSNGLDANSIVASGNTVFLGRKGSSGAPEFYVIDVTTPASPSLTGTADIGSLSLNSLDYDSAASLVFVVANSPSDNDYFSVDVSTLATPTTLTQLPLTGVPSRLIYGSTPDKVFIASGADDQELQIVAP